MGPYAAIEKALLRAQIVTLLFEFGGGSVSIGDNGRDLRRSRRLYCGSLFLCWLWLRILREPKTRPKQNNAQAANRNHPFP